MKVGSTFGVNTPDVYKDFDKLIKDWKAYIGTSPSLTIPSEYHDVLTIPTFLGIEVEAENLPKDVAVPNFWIVDVDSSLRNGGKEFKGIPFTPEQAFKALSMLWHVLGKKPDFSWRCGFHVHVNVTELEGEEFKKFVLLCLLCEQVLFEIAGEDREQNNNCVPLCRSTLSGILNRYFTGRSSLKDLVKTWNGEGNHGHYKYTATNFARLTDLGTVEFRQLGGTKDLAVVHLWVAMLLKIYAASITLSTQELQKAVEELNSTRSYALFVKKIFGPQITTTIVGFMKHSFQEIMEHPVTRVKELMVSAPKFKGCEPNSSMMGYATEALKTAPKPKPKKEGPTSKK
jgi:hypothetical protein